jgi:hypothetical protein
MLKTWNVNRASGGGAMARRWLGDDPEVLAAYADEELPKRPKTRGDCLEGGSNAQRPCPYFSCRHHLGIEINPLNGAIKFNFATVEVDEMPETCALDIADRFPHGAPLPVVQAATGLSYDRNWQAIDEATKHARELAAGIGDVPLETSPSKPRKVAQPTTDTDLCGISIAVHASRPTFRKAPHRSVPREEVERLYPGAAISPQYGQPRPKPQGEDGQAQAQRPPWAAREWGR